METTTPWQSSGRAEMAPEAKGWGGQVALQLQPFDTFRDLMGCCESLSTGYVPTLNCNVENKVDVKVDYKTLPDILTKNVYLNVEQDWRGLWCQKQLLGKLPYFIVK